MCDHSFPLHGVQDSSISLLRHIKHSSTPAPGRWALDSVVYRRTRIIAGRHPTALLPLMLPWQCRLRLLIPDTRGQSKRRSGRALGCCCCATTQKPYPLIPSSWRRSKVAQPIRCSILVARRSFLLCIECIVVGVVLEKWRLVADNHDDDDCHHTSSKKNCFFTVRRALTATGI